jgi:hypothetical protein
MTNALLIAGTVLGIAIAAVAIMTWLSKSPGSSTCPVPDGIHLDLQSARWQISPARDAVEFIRALPQVLPPDSTLCLEGTSTADDVRTFLESRQATQSQKVQSGTIWPASRMFHIPATTENIEGLARLFSNHATPEICDHFHVYGPGGMILEWYDCFSDPLTVSKEIAEERIRSFCDVLGCQYTTTE